MGTDNRDNSLDEIGDGHRLPWCNGQMSDTRWLDDREQRMWRRYRDMRQLLELAIERNLQQETGMSLSDYAVLVVLSEIDTDGIRARDLGSALGWDRSRLSHQVRRMEGRGLVTKRVCPEDARGTLISLTEKGATAIVEAAPIHVTKVRELFVDQLSDAEIDQLTAVFDRIIARIDEVDGIALPD